MNTSSLAPPSGATHRRKIVGRGPSSGHGKTSTRGHKGQKARSKVALWFEGGQMPLTRRVPKRGFTSVLKQRSQIVNVKDLNIFQKDVVVVGPELLIKTGLVKKKGKIKILGKGKLNLALEVKAHQFSQEAEKKIKEAGGKIGVIRC